MSSMSNSRGSIQGAMRSGLHGGSGVKCQWKNAKGIRYFYRVECVSCIVFWGDGLVKWKDKVGMSLPSSPLCLPFAFCLLLFLYSVFLLTSTPLLTD
jgi:hypothetical protein